MKLVLLLDQLCCTTVQVLIGGYADQLVGLQIGCKLHQLVDATGQNVLYTEYDAMHVSDKNRIDIMCNTFYW